MKHECDEDQTESEYDSRERKQEDFYEYRGKFVSPVICIMVGFYLAAVTFFVILVLIK